MASITESTEISDAILVLIGFPGSGKSETGNTVIGRQVFKNGPQLKQETHDVLGLHLTVMDTTGFESLTEFIQIYKSLEDLECQKVVFGLTIRIGRLNPGFIETVHAVFKDNAIGEHLKRRTFLIFTRVDELSKKGEEIYEDKFENWLRNADGIHKLITSLQLDYCVILNKPGGSKQVEQVEQIVRHVQTVLKRGSEQNKWCRVSESIPYDYIDTCTSLKGNENWNEVSEDSADFTRKMHQEIKTTPFKVMELVQKLQAGNRLNRNRIIRDFLHDIGSHMTGSDVDKLLDRAKAPSNWPCKIF